MKINVAGRVKNMTLSERRPLLPLYEAVVNSIQAIEDAEHKQGSIRIEIVRDTAHLLKDSAPETGDIVGFNIIDNGIGFDDDNYAAFETADTTYKADRGGKGIGRFLWLVAFERVEVESTFKQDNTWKSRRFDFTAEGEGVSKVKASEAQTKKRSTIVRLVGFREKYRKQCPKRVDTIASRLVEHCLEFFIRPDCPQITLSDEAVPETINLNERFAQEMAEISKQDRVIVQDRHFDVIHVRLHSTHEPDHLVHFCAHNRVAKSEKLIGRVPNLTRRLHDANGRDFVYAAYVDGDFLDKNVNPERTEFTIEEDATGLMGKEITWKDIRTAVLESTRKFLAPYTDPIRDEKRKRIDNFVAHDGPMYRPIIKYVEPAIDMIDPEINDDDLDLRLYEAYHNLQVELKREGKELFQQAAKDEDWDEFCRQLEDYFGKVNDINKSDLARYVCHRRTVLDFLQRQLSVGEDGKFRREDRVHQIIFPMRKTSSEVLFEDHNLWVLDEKLAYHAFLASDKPLNTTPEIATKSRKEPDILVFDKACAFATGDPPYSAVTVIEFKRPMRTTYDHEKDNPFVQIRAYITDIRSGKARTPVGRDIPVIGQDVPFYCYLVCDIDDKLATLAEDFELTRRPDGQGFFGWKKNYNAYVEVVSYSKMVMDAKKRNVAFFDKLGLPTRVQP